MTIQIIVFVEAGQVCEIKDFHMDCLSGRRGKILWESEKTVLLFIILKNLLLVNTILILYLLHINYFI